MHYQFDVKMTCSGCSRAVERALSKLEGLDSVNVDLAAQKVDVQSEQVDYDTVLAKIQKTGKTVLGGRTV